jgi:DNA-binding transcriptional MerR regulator
VSAETYKLEELARAAGTSPRTVRYYVQRGLIPAPAFRGKDTAYGREHLVRLRAIRQLQQAFFPLEAIAVELERKSLEELEKIADGSVPVRVQVRQSETVEEARQSSTGGPSKGRVFQSSSAWRRMEIMPGLELFLADDASDDAKRAAERIVRETREGVESQ